MTAPQLGLRAKGRQFSLLVLVNAFVGGMVGLERCILPRLAIGCLFGLPVPLLLLWAPSWGWVIAANVLLGPNATAR